MTNWAIFETIEIEFMTIWAILNTKIKKKIGRMTIFANLEKKYWPKWDLQNWVNRSIFSILYRY